MITLDDTQQAILDHLDDEIGVPVVEQAIPTFTTVERDATGQISPYVAIQFGDLIPVGGGEGFAGSPYDDYRLPVYLQAIAKDPGEARRLGNFITGIFLGREFVYGGHVRKRVGGSMFPLENNNAGVEAYLFPLSFSLLVQIAQDDIV